MTEHNYDSWPLGKTPKHLQRPELDQIKEKGYDWNDPREAVDMFEKKIAKFAGSKYAVSCDCCTNGLFLALKYINQPTTVTIPRQTYVSVPMLITQAGYKVKFEDKEWSGLYQLDPLPIYDSAVRWNEGMYIGGDALQVISFQIKKRIPIGRGGVILTDSEEAYKRLKLMSYDGRDLSIPYEDPKHVVCEGYHMYMTPEDAARGILIIDEMPKQNEDSGNHNSYPDVTQWDCVRNLGS
jgi:dTDP-4-amino-4,6-dideoxygalactose transaminase